MQGLIEFASLIEQANPTRREKILARTDLIDPSFLEEALKKVVYYEELEFVDTSILAEILAKASPMILAFSLRGMPETFRKYILHQLGYREMRATMEEEEKILKKVSEEFVIGARNQILKIARKLEKQGKFVFEVLDCPRLKTGKKSVKPNKNVLLSPACEATKKSKP